MGNARHSLAFRMAANIDLVRAARTTANHRDPDCGVPGLHARYASTHTCSYRQHVVLETHILCPNIVHLQNACLIDVCVIRRERGL